jgi:hypothetical protein
MLKTADTPSTQTPPKQIAVLAHLVLPLLTWSADERGPDDAVVARAQLDLVRAGLALELPTPRLDIPDVFHAVDDLAPREQLPVVVAAIDTRDESLDPPTDVNGIVHGVSRQMMTVLRTVQPVFIANSAGPRPAVGRTAGGGVPARGATTVRDGRGPRGRSMVSSSATPPEAATGSTQGACALPAAAERIVPVQFAAVLLGLAFTRFTRQPATRDNRSIATLRDEPLTRPAAHLRDAHVAVEHHVTEASAADTDQSRGGASASAQIAACRAVPTARLVQPIHRLKPTHPG